MRHLCSGMLGQTAPRTSAQGRANRLESTSAMHPSTTFDPVRRNVRAGMACAGSKGGGIGAGPLPQSASRQSWLPSCSPHLPHHGAPFATWEPARGVGTWGSLPTLVLEASSPGARRPRA